MPDFNDRGPEFRGEMPPPPFFGHGPGDDLYFPGAHFGPSVGTEKDRDAIDEKVKLENIHEIPKYDIIKRFKAWRTYRKQYASFNRIKESMYWRMVKLNRIDAKLQKYENYPDDVINRDKLMKERAKLQSYLVRWQAALTRTTKVKLQTYAKALGYEILPDDAFEILNPPSKDSKKTTKKKEEVKPEEVKKDDAVEVKKEEKVDVNTNVNSNTSTITPSVKTSATKTNKNKHHRSNTRKNKASDSNIDNNVNSSIYTNTEKLLKLYNLLVKKYGREDAKKYLENFIEQEKRKSSLDELSEMLDSASKNEERSVRK